MRRYGYLTLFFITAAGWLPGQQRTVTKADIDRWMKELSNWGRWGKEDQLGTMNLITPAKRKQAAALVTDGVSVSLAHDTEKEKASDNPSPFVHVMKLDGSNTQIPFAVDEYTVDYHGFAHTHMDALAHMFWQGKQYNGFPAAAITKKGAPKLAVTNLKSGVFTRGVLVDIPWLKGVPYLEPGTPIYPEDLDAFEKKAGIKIGAGDAFLLYTGRWALRAKRGPWGSDQIAGLHASCARWLKTRDIAVIGSDAGLDVAPSRVEGYGNPIHQFVLIAWGTPILDNLDLEAVSAAARQRKRFDFLLTAAPIPVTGGTGSPLNPIATF